MRIAREYTFEAAHRLPMVPKGHRCGTMHGHSYRVRVWVEGKIDKKMGWVEDFGDIDARVKPLIAQLDHQTLNKIIRNPTAENLAKWLYERANVSMVEVMETERSVVQYP